MTTRWTTDAARYGPPALVLVAAAGVSLHAQQRLVAVAAVLDLTITTPVLAYFLLVRAGRIRGTVLVPVVVLGYALAAFTLPDAYREVLTPLRLLAIPAEIGLVTYVVIAARRALARRPGEETDLVGRVRAAARRALGNRIAADVLTTETMLLYYALRRRRQGRKADTFTVHRGAGYGPLLAALALAIVVETIAVHFLVRLWSPTVAYVVTGLSVYALLWLLGDYRALVSRTTRVSATHLLFRFGLRWEADIPLDRIVLAGERPPDGSILVASVLGAPNLHLRFLEPVEVLGMYGWRKVVTELRVRVDEPAALRFALERR